MIKINCIKCNEALGIDCNDIKEIEGCDFDCCKCNFPMIVLNDKVVDFNKHLQQTYSEMGMKIEENKNYTESFVELK